MNIDFKKFKEYFVNTNMILEYNYEEEDIRDFLDLFKDSNLDYESNIILKAIIEDSKEYNIFFYSNEEGRVAYFIDESLILDEDVLTMNDILYDFKKDNNDNTGNSTINDYVNVFDSIFSSNNETWFIKDENGNEVFSSESDLKVKKFKHRERKKEKILNPLEIKSHLDKYVIGQNEAKESLSVVVYNHYKRIRMNKDENRKNKINKSNILMVGKSGSGKTLLVSTIAKILNVPFITVNATQFSPTGYVGDNVEDIITRLKDKALENCQDYTQGIVFIDEIDKLAGSMSEAYHGRGSLSQETQGALLKLIEGEELSVESQSMYGGRSKTILDTKDILFICAGAFDNIESLTEKKIKKSTIGFNGNIERARDFDKWKEFGSEEIIQYGLMPELMGRLPVLLKLSPLKTDDLVRILTEPDDAIVKEYRDLLLEENIELVITEEALQTVAKLAMKRKVGARGLRGILEGVMHRVMFNHFCLDKRKKCVITKEHVIKNIIPELEDIDNE